jgi:hypothetical protein
MCVGQVVLAYETLYVTSTCLKQWSVTFYVDGHKQQNSTVEIERFYVKYF